MREKFAGKIIKIKYYNCHGTNQDPDLYVAALICAMS